MRPRSAAFFALAAAALATCEKTPSEGSGVAAVAVQPLEAALCVGDSVAYSAQVMDIQGRVVPGQAVRWSSSAPLVIAVDSESGLAHALATGSASISATAGLVTSSVPGQAVVPTDLVPEFVPDTVVLAPSDTFTLGVRLRRQSAGPVPSRTPSIAPLDTAPASITATGLVTAKAPGTASFTVSACGASGHGAVRVFTPPDSLTGTGYLWLSGPPELRARLATVVKNFTLASKKPAFQVFGSAAAGAKQFAYEDTVALTAAGPYGLDSIRSSEVYAAQCAPPRPFAVYGDNAPSSLLSLHGGTAAVTTFAAQTGYANVSGRLRVQMSGVVNGILTSIDTLQAIFTFSAPVRDTANACP